jgi:hypothetical protein
MPSALTFNAELLSVADSTRTAMLNTCEDIATYVPSGDVRNIDIYCPTNELNRVFYSSTFWGNGVRADTSADYSNIINNIGSNNLSDAPTDFQFDWTQLTGAAAMNDFSVLDANVFNQSSGDVYSYAPSVAPGPAQNVKTLLADISLMGTVWYNHSDAILNQPEFLVPTLTVSSILDTLQTVNAEALEEYRDDLFNQAYVNYKYDLSYARLALEDGDSFSIPVRFSVTQDVQYDLSGSSRAGHGNNMLTFVVGTNEFSVMKQETASNEMVYMLRFVASGVRDNSHA